MGKGRSHKSFPEEDNSKKKIRNQSEVIKGLQKEIKRLKAELHTLNKAFEKAAAYMSDESKQLKVEDLIKAAEKNQTLKQAKVEHAAKEAKICPPNRESKEDAEKLKEETRRKFADWAKKNRAMNDSSGDDE